MGVDLPTFAGLLQNLKRGTFHLSTNWVEIPAAYLDPVAPVQAIIYASTSVPSVTTTTASRSALSAMSTLTTDSATRPNVARVNNPTIDDDFASISIRPGGARTVICEHRPPANEAGNEFCVAWWTRGGCFPNCGQRAAHTAFASAAERTRLLAYAREHIQAPAGTST